MEEEEEEKEEEQRRSLEGNRKNAIIIRANLKRQQIPFVCSNDASHSDNNKNKPFTLFHKRV